MRTAIICFSLQGAVTAEKLKIGLEMQEQGVFPTEIHLAKKSRYLPDSITVSLQEWTKEQFSWADCLIFVGACGIAVRHIAPYIRSKKTDPAVLAVDECGKFVISLLSGHLGGANELTERAANILGAVPVITTATDLNHCFAADVFAKKNNCEILNMQAAKEVSAALLAGKKVGFYSEFPIEGSLPNGLVRCDAQGRAVLKKENRVQTEELQNAGEEKVFEIGLAVTIRKDCRPFSSTAVVVPRNVVLGMGCRKGKEAESIRRAAGEAVAACGIYQQAVAKLTSIDLKKEERGLQELAKQWKIPFKTFNSEELQRAEGTFCASSFVKSVTDVDNVCERSAVCGSNQGKLIQKKIGRDGVTSALAAGEWRMHFE